jgi:hypothetical protein
MRRFQELSGLARIAPSVETNILLNVTPQLTFKSKKVASKLKSILKMVLESMMFIKTSVMKLKTSKLVLSVI